MQYFNKMVHAKMQNILIEKTVAEFTRSIGLIENLTDAHYTKIGAHFRHNLDFANAFMLGLEAGKIDYEKRERDERIEQNRGFAIEQIVFLIRRLQNLSNEILEREILVASEIQTDVWHKSSVAREFEFLHSHTIHHYALIAEKLSNSGVEITADFGVAPSTLKFWNERKKAA